MAGGRCTGEARDGWRRARSAMPGGVGPAMAGGEARARFGDARRAMSRRCSQRRGLAMSGGEPRRCPAARPGDARRRGPAMAGGDARRRWRCLAMPGWRDHKMSERRSSSLVAILLQECPLPQEHRGELERARDMFQQSLAMRKRVYGSQQHADMAVSLHGLAAVMAELESPQYALKLHRKAMVLRKELLGERHPDVAASMHSVATVLA
ncbi:hypothetical protein CYMTET_32614, partial [Cymbomonas tetramitiformis]